jgi:hypothetical protein
MDFLVKRGRGLDPAVLGWLMATLGVGPGVGEVHFLVDADSAYYSWLRDDMRVNPSLIHYTLAAGEDALTAARNDCLCVYPGAYDETAEVAWDKANTHLVGMGGPNIYGDYTEPNVIIYTDSTDVASVLTVTGQNSQFHNATIANFGANAACLTAVTVNIYGTHWKNMGIVGNTNSTINAVEASASLYIGAAGMYPIFDTCVIGQDVWGVRTKADQGVIRFVGAGRPNVGLFRNCRIKSVGDDVECCMVAMPAATSCGRGWLFDNTTFEHFASDGGGGTNLNQAFHTYTGCQKDTVLLQNCTAFGIDAWADDAYEVILSNMAVPAVTGGLAIEPT